MTSYTVADVARAEQITEATVRHLIRAGVIRARRVDPTKRKSPYRISEQALREYRAKAA